MKPFATDSEIIKKSVALCCCLNPIGKCRANVEKNADSLNDLMLSCSSIVIYLPLRIISSEALSCFSTTLSQAFADLQHHEGLLRILQYLEHSSVKGDNIDDQSQAA